MRKRPSRMLALATLLLGAALACPAGAAERVVESAREVPVAYDVDVVVVGGSTGAVAAAVSAADKGARVFLAAPRPYLGDDMTATLRLWREEGDELTTPLACDVYNDDVQGAFSPDPNAMRFTYTADRPSAPQHADSNPPSKLSDLQWGSASAESVQYDGDVSLVADLGKVRPIDKVVLAAYHRETGALSPFKIDNMVVSVSDDGKAWKELGTVRNEASGAGDIAIRLVAPVLAPARYVRLAVHKTADCQRVLLGEIEIVGTGPAQAVAAAPIPPRPMHVKKTLDDALLRAGVTYLYSCYPTDVLVDAQGQPCGIVMANRAGRQAVVARTIIDATDRGLVARLAGAQAPEYPAGEHTFRRVVIGGEVLQAENMTGRVMATFHGPHPNAAGTASGDFSVIEYTLKLPMADGSAASWAKADQQARTLTYHPEQQFTSDVLFELPPDPIVTRGSLDGAWPGAAALPIEALQPKGVEHLYLLSGAAGVSRELAQRLVRPVVAMELGARLGEVAAADASQRPQLAGTRVRGDGVAGARQAGEVRELLEGVRPVSQDAAASVPQPQRGLPVLGRYDVVVIGGGTGGAPAGIGAARQGAKTLVVEYLSGLGGVGTEGAISSYYWGNRVGFTAEIPGGGKWVIEQRMEWYRSQLLEAGADIWFGTIGCGAVVDAGKVVGAVVATPQGRGVVIAGTVIDATGNSDLAAAAGAETIYTDADEFGMQGTGLPPRNLGTTYTNTDFTLTDETDMVDIWHLFVYAKDKYPDAFDQGRLIDTRERRRIVGDHVISVYDQMNGRNYPDTVVACWSNFDTHGYTVDPYFMLEHPEKKGIRVNIPYRAMLPKGLDGVLVVGLGISSHRDAVPLIRMQPDIQNGGYAAGVAAAMASRAHTSTRHIDLDQLKKHLVEIGNLPESVLTDTDSYPLPASTVAEAVAKLSDGTTGAAVVLAQPQTSLPMLRDAYQASEGDARLNYAKALALLGDPTGVDALAAAVAAEPAWDQGWSYVGMGQFGHALSRLDTLLIALGHTRDPGALPVLLEKLDKLTADDAFSHHRAIALALEVLGDPAAAKPLADHLAKPGIQGHVQDSVERAREQTIPGGTTAVAERRESLRELVLARALYRCGDYEGLGETILRRYTGDLRGHFARHAQAVLDAGKGTR